MKRKKFRNIIIFAVSLCIVLSGSYIFFTQTVSSIYEMSESYNLADGDYLLCGTGIITVNGVQYNNGDTLTEPGTYVVQTDLYKKTVTLFDNKKKSDVVAYNNGVMPVSGFNGPYSMIDKNGTNYDFFTDQIYGLIKGAGINLITSSFNSETDLIRKGLALAEKNGIGVYVDDKAVFNSCDDKTALAQLVAKYNYFSSFRGFHIVDEPGTAYVWRNFRHLVDYADTARTINNICNIGGYMNLLPASNADSDDYWNEVIVTTDARFISFDDYIFSRSDADRFNVYFYHLNSARRLSMQYKIPFWSFIQAGSNWNDAKEDMSATTNNTPTKGQLVWNVNTSLAYGAKGIQYFPLVQPAHFAYTEGGTYDYQRNGLIGADGSVTKWYDYAKTANTQIAAVDEYLLNCTSKRILVKGGYAEEQTQVTNDFSGLKLSSIGIEKNTVIKKQYLFYNEYTEYGALVGVFDYNRKEAYYVVNYDFENSRNITLNFTASNNYSVIADSGNCTSGIGSGTGTSCNLKLTAGGAALVIIE